MHDRDARTLNVSTPSAGSAAEVRRILIGEKLHGGLSAGRGGSGRAPRPFHNVRAVVLSLATFVTCTTTQSNEHSAVQQTLQAIIAADNSGDVEAIMRLYTPDAVLLPPTGPPVAGRAAIEERYRAGFAEFALEVKFASEETQVAGAWAFDRGTTTGRYIWRDGREPTPFIDKYLMILAVQSDGTWRIARLMWSPSSDGAG